MTKYAVDIYVNGDFVQGIESGDRPPLTLKIGEEVVYNSVRREVVDEEKEIFGNGDSCFVTVRYYLR